MKKLICFALLTLAALGVAHAESLYLPNFVMSEDPAAATTLFSLSNAGDTAKLVRANVYSVDGAYTTAFNIELPPHATKTFNLRDALDGNTYVCPGQFYVANMTALMDGSGVAHGFIGFDTVTSCSLASPADPTYSGLLGDGSGVWGDWLYIDTSTDFAQGGELSKPKAGVFELRYLAKGSVVDGTELVVFAPSATPGTPLPVLAYSEAGEPVSLAVNFVGGLRITASNRFDVDDRLAPSAEFGRLRIDCRGIPCFVLGIVRSGVYDATLPAVQVPSGEDY